MTTNLGVLLRTYPNHFKCSFESLGFPVSSAGKESACNAGDPLSIPVSGRYPGEWIDYPLQYSWASLVAPAMWKTWVQSLDCEDPLEEGMATHFCILAWKISWTEESMGLQTVRHDWTTNTYTPKYHIFFIAAKYGAPLLKFSVVV